MDTFIVLLDSPRACERCKCSEPGTAPYVVAAVSETGEVKSAVAACRACLTEEEENLLLEEQYAVSMPAFKQIWSERQALWAYHQSEIAEAEQSMSVAASRNTKQAPAVVSPQAAQVPPAVDALVPAATPPVAKQRPNPGLIRPASEVAARRLATQPSPEPVPPRPVPAKSVAVTVPSPATEVAPPAIVKPSPAEPAKMPAVQEVTATATVASTVVRQPEPLPSTKPTVSSAPSVSLPPAVTEHVRTASSKPDLVPTRTQLVEMVSANQAELVCKLFSHEWYLHNGDIYHVEAPRRVGRHVTDIERAAELLIGHVCEKTLAA